MHKFTMYSDENKKLAIALVSDRCTQSQVFILFLYFDFHLAKVCNIYDYCDVQ